MKAKFRSNERGEPTLVITPESDDEAVLCSVFSARCKADGFRIAGCDHEGRGGVVDEIAFYPAPVDDAPPAKSPTKK